MAGDPDRKPIRPMGPYAPPNPSEAETNVAEPMAVANDKRTPHDSFLPTSNPLDAFAPEVAEKHRAHPARRDPVTRSREENRRAERPPGYTEPDEQSFRHFTWEDIEDGAGTLKAAASEAPRMTDSNPAPGGGRPPRPPDNERPAEQPASPREPSPVRPPGEPTPGEGPRRESPGEPEPATEGS